MKNEGIQQRHFCGLLLGLLLSISVPVSAIELTPVDGVLTITVTSQDELYNNYPAADITATGATRLKIVGPLNTYNDFKRIKDVIDETLTQVDLSEAILPDNTLPSSAFSNASTLTTVVLPSNLTALGSSAFYNCSALTSVNLPTSLNSIGGSAFQGCSSLSNLLFDVTGGFNISYDAFRGCTSLKSIIIYAQGDVTLSSYSNGLFDYCTALQRFELHTPGKLTSPRAQLFNISSTGALTTVILDAQGEGSSLSNNTFHNCKQLTSVVLPAGLTDLPYSFFDECNALTSLTIPASLTTMGNSVFSGCSSLTSLDFSATQLSTIGQSAFAECSSLQSVSMPASLTSIGDATFRQCSSLESIDLSGTQITSIPNSTFSNCSSLTSVQLPSTISSLGYNAFYYCNSLTGLTLNVTGALNIGHEAFYNCPQLTAISITANGDVTLGGSSYNRPILSCPALQTFELHTPGKLTANCYMLFDMGTNGGALTTVILDAEGAGSTMGTQAFQYCKQLTSVTLPTGLTSPIGSSFFYECNALPSVTIPASVPSIGSSAFYKCSSLESIDLSQTQVTTIDQNAFSYCTSLASVLLPAGITSIGSSAFYQCSSLESIDLSQSLITSIPNSCFSNCSSLTSVQLPATISNIGTSAFYYSGLTTLNLTTSQPLTVEYQAFYYCTHLTDVNLTTSGALAIRNSAFYHCTALRNMTLNAGGDVTIGTSQGASFTDCTALENFELHTPGKLTDVYGHMLYHYPTASVRRAWLDAKGEGSVLRDYTFQHCQQLTDVILPAGLVSVGSGTFYDCTSLQGVTIPATLASVGTSNGMFNGCTALESIDLSQTQLTTMGNNAFYGCTSLTSVALPAGFTTIGQSMFNGCTSLTTISLPGSVTSIGQNAFRGCTQLPSITIPASVTTMGTEVFRGCTSLTSAVVLASATLLPERTFQDCTSLQTVSMPASGITTIGEHAFDGCSQLSDITLPSGLTAINQYAFENCSSLANISLPSTLTTFGNDVFYGCLGLVMLEVPEGVSSLPQSLFSGCSGMQSLYLPSTITEINNSAFSGLTNLIDLHIMATTPPPLSSYSRAPQVTLFVPEASIPYYQEAVTWKDFGNIYAELTNLATLDDGDFALLQAIFQKTNGPEWTRPWVFGATKAETPMLEGVKISNGHVKQLVLINNNLRTHLPQELLQLPECWYINVSRNRFVNDIGDFFDNMTTPNTALTYLDLSDNLLSGNIGRIGNASSELQSIERLPNLTTLKIARNQISDVKPVLPAHITTLDLKGQEIYVYHSYFYENFIDCSQANLPYFFPSILFYRHYYKDYGNIIFLLSAPDAEEPWTVSLYKYATPSTSSYGYSGSGWSFLPKMSEIRLSTNESNVADRSYIPLLFNFQTGDVNYNGDVEVSDLQTLINFAMQPESFPRYSPFNWTAANTILADPGEEEVINVQDVVAEVNLLLDQDIDPVLASRRSPGREESGYQATLSVENGLLVLESELPVAALDLSIVGGVQWSSDMGVFSKKSRGSRSVFYSLFGDVLPAGRTVLGTVSTDSEVTAASLSDTDGNLIPVGIRSGEATGIENLSPSLSQGEGAQTIFDLQGRRIITPPLKKGVYIVNGKKQIVK